MHLAKSVTILPLIAALMFSLFCARFFNGSPLARADDPIGKTSKMDLNKTLGDSIRIMTQDVGEMKIEEHSNPKKVTLAEAVQLAIQHNATIAVAGRAFESSTNAFNQSWYHFYLPTLTLGVNYTSANASGINSSPGVTLTDSSSMTLSGSLPYIGLQYTVAPLGYSATNPLFAGYSFSGVNTAQLTLPLLNGFGPLVSTIGWNQSKISYEIAQLSKDLTVIATVNSIRSAFWDLLAANEAIKIQYQVIANSKNTIDETQIKVANGLLPKFELFNALQNYYTQKTSLITFQQTLNTQQQAFATAIGMFDYKRTSQDPLWFIPDQNLGKFTEIKYEDIDIDQTFKKALESRKDYRVAKENLTIAEYSKNLAGNRRLPSLNLVGGITNSSVTDIARTTAMLNTFDGTNQQTTIGIQLSWTVPWVDALTEYRNANLAIINQETNNLQLYGSIHEQIISAVNTQKMAFRQIQSANLAAQLADAKFDAEMTKYRLGDTPQKNVIDFQKDVALAKQGQLTAYVNYKKALIALDTAVGVMKIE